MYNTHEVTLNRIGKIGVQFCKKPQTNDFDLVKVLINAGYIPTKNFLSIYHDIVNLEEAVKELLKLKFADKNWQNALFPNFPTYVEETPTEVLFLQTIIHYLTTYGAEAIGVNVPTYFPNKPTGNEEVDLEKFKDDINEKLKKGTVVDVDEENKVLYETLDSILYTKTPIKDSEFEFLKDYLYLYDSINLNSIYFNEVKVCVLEHAAINKITNVDPSTLLRLVIYNQTGYPAVLNTKKIREKLKEDVNWNQTPVVKKANFWKLLDQCNTDDIIKSYNQKRKLWNIILHLYDVKNVKRKSSSAAIMHELKKHKGYIEGPMTKYAQVEQMLRQNDREGLNDVFSGEPYLFVEYATRYLKRFFTNKQHAYDIMPILRKLNYKLLFRLWNVVRMSQQREDNQNGYVFVIPFTNMWYTDEGPISLPQRKLKALENCVMKVLSEKVNISEKIFISKNVNTEFKLPLTVRGDSGFLVEKGSCYRIKSDKLRFGIYWKNGETRCDLDLGAVEMDSEFNFIGFVSWNTDYKNQGITFSGDVTDAPEGAAEYLQFYLNSVRGRYILITCNRFSGMPENNEYYIGVQTPTNKKFDEEFDPKNLDYHVTDKFDGAGNKSRYCMVLDTTTGYAYPLMLSSNSRVMSVDKALGHITNMTVNFWTSKVSYKDIFFTLLQENLVRDKEDADVVISDDIQMQKFVREKFEL